MGFSVLSLAEFVYWFSLRMWNDRRAKRKRQSEQDPWGRKTEHAIR